MRNVVYTIFQIILYWIVLVVFKLFFRFEAHEQKNLKEVEDGPVIFVSNHASYIDGAICGISLPRKGFWTEKFFPLRFLTTERFFQWKYFPINIFLKIGGALSVKRTKVKYPDGRHLHDVLPEALEILRHGGKIWIFPEGTFTSDGKIHKGRKGVVFLHQQTGVPIVPVGIIGSCHILNKKLPFLPSLRSLLRLNSIKVVIGKPIYTLGNVSLEEGSRIVMDEIIRLIN